MREKHKSTYSDTAKRKCAIKSTYNLIDLLKVFFYF